jgi:hypothetical protein
MKKHTGNRVQSSFVLARICEYHFGVIRSQKLEFQ